MIITDLRKKRGLTREKLAELSGVPLRTLEQYEQGRLSIEGAAALTVYKIAQALGVTVEDILTPD